MSRPSITVVVPAYNQGPYLEEAIRSLLDQTDAPDEILVSNNHSPDETAEVLARYADRVTAIQPPQHLPACEHGDFVFQQAGSEWVAILSSDDVALPNFVSGFREAISKYRDEAVLCRGGVQLIDNDSKFIENRRLLSVGKYESGVRALKGQIESPKVFFAAVCIKRQAFMKVGGFKDYLAMGDWPLWLELCAEGGFCLVDEIISKYRINFRPGLYKLRLPGEIRDEWRIRSEVMPRVAAHIGARIEPRRLRLVARRRLIGRLNGCLEEGVSDRQENIADILDAWAKYAKAEDIVELYRSGKPIPDEMPLLGKVRRKITPLARRIVGGLRFR